MSELAQWGLIGHGMIGSELTRQLEQVDVAERMGLSPLPQFVVRSSGLYVAHEGQLTVINGSSDPESILTDTDCIPHDVTFVALPSTSDGKLAYGFISHELEQKRGVVTAEKGALANNFKKLREESGDFAQLGINASVGGGTRMIEELQTYCRDPANVRQIHVVCNGTLNDIFSSIAPPQGIGMSLGQAVDQAVRLGYAEPGQTNPYDVIRGEAEGDIPKKTAILFNALGLEPDLVLDWDKLHFRLTDKTITKAIEEARERRFIVSIYSNDYVRSHGKDVEDDNLGGFHLRHGWSGREWHIVSGFRNIKRNPLFGSLAAMTGAFNGFVIGLGPNETDGVYNGGGPGAGPRPTVNTMLDDWLRIRKN